MARDMICLDFDGVLHSYVSGWKGAHIIPDPPMPGAMDALRMYCSHFTVAIFSARSSQEGGIAAMRQWIADWAQKERLGTNWLGSIEYPTAKPPAKVTLDDRALTFTGTWPTVTALKEFKPFYLRK